MTLTNDNSKIIGAARLMEELFESNTYQSWKAADTHLDIIREEIKNRLPEETNIKFFKDHKVIARYIKNNTYSVDVLGLNELLNDLGILVHVARFDDTDELAGYRKPLETYTKFNIGKRGKTEKREYNFDHLNNEELMDLWLQERKQADDLELQIEGVKEQMKECMFLKTYKKLVCSYGSISLLPKKRTHHNDQILEELGAEYMIENSKPNMEALEEFIEKGIILRSEVEEFKTLKTVGTKFVVMTLESYQQMMNMLDYKKSKTSNSLRELWAHDVS